MLSYILMMKKNKQKILCYFVALNTTHVCNSHKHTATMATIAHSRWAADRGALLGSLSAEPQNSFSLKTIEWKVFTRLCYEKVGVMV